MKNENYKLFIAPKRREIGDGAKLLLILIKF